MTSLHDSLSPLRSELLLATRPTPVPIKTVYEHLRRVGLEKYAAILEFHGVSTAEDMGALKLDDILKLSVELKYDPAGQRLVSQLLEAESNKSFMTDSYSLAEVSHIRESFLLAYADTTNECLIKTVCMPLMRQHSHNSFNAEDDDDDEQENSSEVEDAADAAGNVASSPGPLNIDALAAYSGGGGGGGSNIDVNNTVSVTLTSRSHASNSTGSGGGGSAHLELIEPSSLTAERLGELCKAFCGALSSGGKGVISHYNLRRLLAAHPMRPVQCVKAAQAFTAPRTVADKCVKQLDLYAFLKRMGLAQNIHSLRGAEIHLLSNLLATKESVDDLCTTAKRTYKLSTEHAFRLAEVVTKTTSESGNLVNFALHPRARIMQLFQLFYSAGADAFPLFTATKSETEDDDEDEGKTKSDAPANGSANDVSTDGGGSTEGATDASSSVNSAVPTSVGTDSASGDSTATKVPSLHLPASTTVTTSSTAHVGVAAPAPPAVVSPAELEKLSYQFGLLTSDAQGTALVSVLEVLDHLRRHPASPREAVATALAELVNPPFPAAPPVEAREEPPREWIDDWMAGIINADGSTITTTTTTSGDDTSTRPNAADAAASAMGANASDSSTAATSTPATTAASAAAAAAPAPVVVVDMSQYTQKMKDQGFVQREDLALGPLLTVQELEDKVGVNVLAHRRRIVTMHAKLLAAEAAKQQQQQVHNM